MHNTGKMIVGLITVILFHAGAMNTFSQNATGYESTLFASEQTTLAASGGGDRVDELAAEIASMKSELAKKADKPSGKGWSSPKLGGRFFMDYATAMNQDWDGMPMPMPVGNGNNVQNWYGFREARLAVTGTGYDFLDYKFEVGFEKDRSYNASFKDVFLGIQHVPLLEYVRIGNQYVEDAGSEICNGTTNYTFMEAPAPVGQHFMSRRLGVTSRHLFADDRVRMFFGAYGANNISDTHYQKDDNQGLVLNTRMTIAPVFCQDGCRLFLVGAYYNFVDSTSNNKKSMAISRPGGWDLYSSYSLGDYYSDRYQKAGFETVCQKGRFCVQTDLFLQQYADVNNGPGTSIGNQTNYGGFVMARWFLTRDYRKYNLKSACWDSVEVSRPYKFMDQCEVNWPSGYGAWEVAAMYGFYDAFASLTDTDARLTNQQIGAALNWYWNPQVKWAVNYIHDLTDVDYAHNDYRPTGDYFGMSCRVAF